MRLLVISLALLVVCASSRQASAHEFTDAQADFKLTVSPPPDGPLCVIHPASATDARACAEFDVALARRLGTSSERRMVGLALSSVGEGVAMVNIAWQDGAAGRFNLNADELQKTADAIVTQLAAAQAPGTETDAGKAGVIEKNGLRMATFDLTTRGGTLGPEASSVSRFFIIPAAEGMFMCGFVISGSTDRAPLDKLADAAMATLTMTQPARAPVAPSPDAPPPEPDTWAYRFGRLLGILLVCSGLCVALLVSMRKKGPSTPS